MTIVDSELLKNKDFKKVYIEELFSGQQEQPITM